MKKRTTFLLDACLLQANSKTVLLAVIPPLAKSIIKAAG